MLFDFRFDIFSLAYGCLRVTVGPTVLGLMVIKRAMVANGKPLIISLTGMEMLGTLFAGGVEINGFFILFYFEGMTLGHEMFWIHNFDKYS